MGATILSLLLSILGLGFLIFIHELGHFWMAKRRGMRVESFGIGFGRPMYSFEWNGVHWNICWLPFGGYVKIAGMEREQGIDPEGIKDGFFGKSPFDRFIVAFMGPLANIVFAIFLFMCIWASGGRSKNFSDVNNKVGWIDIHSELYKKGVRPGDTIISYDNLKVQGAKDHLHAAMTSRDIIHVKGLKWEERDQLFDTFEVNIKPYSHPQAIDSGILTTGVVTSAGAIIYDRINGLDNPLPKGSPLLASGIQYGDRIVWIDGEKVFSLEQLKAHLNEEAALVTVKRGDRYLLRRLPRVFIEDLKIDFSQKEELSDWQWNARLRTKKLGKLFFIPYNITPTLMVENKLPFFDRDREKEVFLKHYFSEKYEPLEVGDQIVAIYGEKVHSAAELFAHLQAKKILLIVERQKERPAFTIEKASYEFDQVMHHDDFNVLINEFAEGIKKQQEGSYVLLNPITPRTRAELFEAEENVERLKVEVEEEKRHIEAIDNPEKRSQALKYLENRNHQLMLGLSYSQDVKVIYNPTPFALFQDVVKEVLHTLSALLGGYLHPKWMAGPIGIVQVIHHQSSEGIKEALFWIATISLNLGLLNLLPLPVLDGGYICLSIFEMLTGRRVSSKVIEKIIMPFAVMLIGLLLFLTYHDLLRLIGQLLL